MLRICTEDMGTHLSSGLSRPQTDQLSSTADITPRRHRTWKALAWVGGVLALLLVVVYAAGSWYFAGQIHDGISVTAYAFNADSEVVAVTGSSVTLHPLGDMPEGLDTGDVYGLTYDTGYAQLTDLVTQDETTVTRGLTLVTGQLPVVGQQTEVRKEAFPLDPTTFFDVPVQQVYVSGPAGDLPAWYAPGTSQTWAVLVHGKGEPRNEMFRLMLSTTAEQMPSLDITYRGDPENGGGLARFGDTEWPDLEAGVRYAVDQGAAHVVLVGASMGGGVIAAFLEHSVLASYVSAIVFDSPMLDYAATVHHQASFRTIPGLGTPIPSWLVSSAIWVADIRYGLNAGAMNYLDDTSWLKVPTLVFHGSDDTSVPDWVSEQLKTDHPDLVDLMVFQGAPHVGSWNQDPAAYDQKVQTFLAGPS